MARLRNLTRSRPTVGSDNSVRIVGGIALLMSGIIGYVLTLAIAPDQVADYRGLVGLIVIPFVTILFTMPQVARVKKKVDESVEKVDATNRKVDRIEKQTNGMLTAKFEDTIEQAVDHAIRRIIEEREEQGKG